MRHALSFRGEDHTIPVGYGRCARCGDLLDMENWLGQECPERSKRMIDRPGIFTMKAEDYHEDPCPRPSLSASIAHILLSQSPRHAWTAHPRLNPAFKREHDPQFDLGTACHEWFLEGKMDNFAIVHSRDWKKKEAQDQRAAAYAAGKTPLLVEQWERVQQMAQAVSTQLAGFDDGLPPFTNGRAEESLVWQENGVWCRGRMDWVSTDERFIDDLKTTGGTAHPEAWTRGPLFSGGYDVQAALYLRGLKALGGPEATFRFVVVENTPPYALSVIGLGPDVLTLATKKVMRAIELWGECLESGLWPAYPLRTCHAELPPWEESRWMAREYQELGEKP